MDRITRRKMDFSNVKCIVYDCDGVLTDNRVLVDEFGHESVFFHRGDGYGISKLKEKGIKQIIISTEVNPIVSKRAEKLKIDVMYGVHEKKTAVERFCKEHDISLTQTMFIGNDLNDIEAMCAVAFRGCPRDAEPEIKEICHWISSKGGGAGVIRELYRDIASSDGREQELMEQDILSHIDEGKVYAIIPARSGSKGIKDKNIRSLCGYPLMAYSIVAAALAKNVNRVIVSTDSEDYAKIANRFGAETPFLRPAEISGDLSTDIEFLRHAIEWFYGNEKKVPEYWVHLRATCPIRDPEIIDAAIEKIKRHPEATSLLSACIPEDVLTPYKWLTKDDIYFKSIFFENNDDSNWPRQSYPDAYMRSVYVDILKTKTIVGNNLLFGSKILSMETEETYDIDGESALKKVSDELPQKAKMLLNYLHKGNI